MYGFIQSVCFFFSFFFFFSSSGVDAAKSNEISENLWNFTTVVMHGGIIIHHLVLTIPTQILVLG